MKQTTILQNVKKEKVQLFVGFLKKEIVFTIALTLALLSSVFQMPKPEFINLRVLISLFNLMVAVKAFEQLKLLDRLAVAILYHCHNSRTVSAILVLLSFFSSMFVTNDVALITFVPLTLIISKKAEIAKVETIIFQTIAANMGSSLTPMGNPQNLFIFSFYRLGALEFFSTVGLFVGVGILLLAIFVFRMECRELKIDLPKHSFKDYKKAAIWGIVFIITIVSILGGVSYQLAFIAVLLTALLNNRSLLAKIDYLLLFTFICFFVFIGNLSNIEVIQEFIRQVLSSKTSVYFSSILASQVISNVPAAILLAKFTEHWQPLLLGVNIGGLGTLIGSLASLISYKLFSSDYPKEIRDYFVKFSLYNLGFLVILAFTMYLLTL